ncbi:ribosome silencing factor [Leptolyngbya sp. FACHB-261]|uniref:ribosome silencing factor n=1 Tax=Leptolyngbya sp. FACHB-261 TaxID=2692806 RepID=UPI0037BEAB52
MTQNNLHTQEAYTALQISPDDHSYQLAMTIAEAADDRKGGDVVLLRVGEVSVLADYFVLVTGFSKTQVRAIAGSIEDKVLEQWQRRPVRLEGQSEGTWLLQDYGEVIVHIMMPQEREFYDLEAFWGHAPRLVFSSSV